MNVAVIANLVSGPVWRRRPAGDVDARVRAALARHGVEGTLSFTAERGHATSLARDAVAGGADVVVAWGGDGTINEVAAALVGTSAVLGIVPVGSGNGLARELGIPARPEDAMAVALGRAERVIDVGSVNGRAYVNCAGIGFDAHVADVFAAKAGQIRGLPAYAAVTVRELFRFEPGRYRIEAAGGPAEDVRALLICVANTRQWGNGALIAPQAVMDDDRLDVVIVPPRSPLYVLANAWRLFSGSLTAVPGVETRQVREATITAERPAPVQVDGEPLGLSSTIRIAVRRAALRVRVPAPGPSGSGPGA